MVFAGGGGMKGRYTVPKHWGGFQASVHPGCYWGAYFRSPDSPGNLWLPWHPWRRHKAECESRTSRLTCLVRFKGLPRASQVVLKFMKFTDFPLLLRPGDKFFFISLSFPPLLSSKCLVWSFQSFRFQKRQEKELSSTVPALPPPLPLESLKQRIWMGSTTCSEEMNEK